MSATPNEIKRAIWTELSRLVVGYAVTGATPTEMEIFSPAQQDTSASQPFRSLHHYAGEVSRALSDSREHGAAITGLKKVPAMLLAWEGTRPQGTSGAHSADGPQLVQVVSRVHWRVFIVVADPRGDAWAMDAALDASHAVELALSEFTIPGLFDGGSVRWVESVPWVTARRNSYITVARFFADTELPASTDPTPGDAFEVQGTVDDAAPDTDAAPVPVAPFSAFLLP